MAEIDIRDLGVAYGRLHVLKNLNLTVADGEFVVLLGPSGCGKSTLLNSIAGLQEVDSGQIFIGKKNVTWKEPSARGLAMVFQAYALYPRMTVYKNLAFALQVAGVPRAEVDQRVRRAAEMLQITEFLDRRPYALSGGQRQRVAIGRALVRDVDVFLFDEPLSNLDAQLRVELRVEIKRLHRRLGKTIVYVTHDQVEAMTLADRIAVMNKGVVQQVADTETIYDRPANRFVAGFVGSPGMNFINGKVLIRDGALAIQADDQVIVLPNYRSSTQSIDEGQPVVLGVRPERLAMGNGDTNDGKFSAVVDVYESLGAERVVWATIAGQTIAVRAGVDSVRPVEGSTIPLSFTSSFASLFDVSTGARI
ncbi:MAG: sn-glycerol-3-phosphate ABC transporter ATP-binding protein UgpC [Bradyrhizobium sp.]|nr:sn-glycerol-3-phosphate ABC transporter ATP-binding protein UgpC [Bradyrhizobium sp.]